MVTSVTPVAASLIEKYQQILAADPRSRIFVELARALLDHGDPRRAMEVCRAGLEHHPKSILGRVTWGRALLATGDVTGAQDQFDIAIGIDPGTPYAYNLVGDALLAAGLFKEALPVLARGVELQPADAAARARLAEAQRRAGGAASLAIPAAARPAGPEPAPGPPPVGAGQTLIAYPAVTAPAPGPPPPADSTTLPGTEVPTEEVALRLAFDELPAETDQPGPAQDPASV
jgi:tetratricopeptide (TPR) repeat protein